MLSVSEITIKRLIATEAVASFGVGRARRIWISELVKYSQRPVVVKEKKPKVA